MGRRRELRLPVQQSSVDECVAADRALLAVVLAPSEDDLYLHGRQLTDPRARRDVDDFTVRAGGDLTRRAAHLGAGRGPVTP